MKSETELAEARRRRQYRITTRLLREYTVRLNCIADDLGNYLDGLGTRTNTGTVPCPVLRGIWRFAEIHKPIRDLSLFVSQMLVHYALDEAEKADLTLRLADIENAFLTVRYLSIDVAERHDIDYPLRESAVANKQPVLPKNGASFAARK